MDLESTWNAHFGHGAGGATLRVLAVYVMVALKIPMWPERCTWNLSIAGTHHNILRLAGKRPSSENLLGWLALVVTDELLERTQLPLI